MQIARSERQIMGKKYFVKQLENVTGPYSASEVRDGVSRDQIDLAAFVGQSENGPWHPIGKVLVRTKSSSTPSARTAESTRPAPAPEHVAQQAVGHSIGESVDRKTNTLGLVGLVLSVASWLTCLLLFPLGWLLCPIALLISIVGALFEPRRVAIAGVCLSSIAALLPVGWLLYTAGTGRPVREIQVELNQLQIQNAISEFYEENRRLPTEAEYSNFAVATQYPGFRFNQSRGSFGKLTHFGLDQMFDTQDDYVTEIDFSSDQLSK